MIRDFKNEDPYGPQNHALPPKSGAGVRSHPIDDTWVPPVEMATQRPAPWLCDDALFWRGEQLTRKTDPDTLLAVIRCLYERARPPSPWSAAIERAKVRAKAEFMPGIRRVEWPHISVWIAAFAFGTWIGMLSANLGLD